MTHATSSSVPTLTSKPVGASTEPARQSTTASLIGMIFVSSEFLQRLVESHKSTYTWLKVIETGITTLFEQMKSGVETRFE